MIKLSYKCKPHNGFVHSVGIKQISELLNDILVYDDLKMSFDKEEGMQMGIYVPGWDNRFLKKQAKDLLNFKQLISGNYSYNLNCWSINLKTVKSENNRLVKRFLIEIGVPLLRNWFESEKTESWFLGNRYFVIGLNDNFTEYCLLETYNDQITEKKIEKMPGKFILNL